MNNALFIGLFLASFIFRINGQVEILTMEREGTAGVYLSEQTGVATLIDGGRKGGLTKPRLDGKPVLEALLARGYRTLVVSCSHPHDDHAGGLRELIMSDSNLTKFQKITFVDSGYPGAESLYEQFRKMHPSFPAASVSYSSAKSRNAFLGIGNLGTDLKVSNFEYIPRLDAPVHGHAIIHHVEITKNGKRCLLVDFDDADNVLIREWVERAKRNPDALRPDVIIAPHHNADTSDISPLLEQQIRPKAVIITANPRNSYLHPGPNNTAEFVNAIGADNVFITGAHDNIRVTENGVITRNNKRTAELTIDTILNPIRTTLERQAAEFEERSLERNLSPAESRRYEDLKKSQASVEKLLSIYQGGGDLGEGPAVGGLPSPRPTGPSGPTPGGNSVGEFTMLRDRFEKALKTHSYDGGSGIVGQASTSSRAAARSFKFSSGLRMMPIRGGIIIGNTVSPDSSKVKSAYFIVTNSAAAIVVTVEQGGRTDRCMYDGMTAMELWSAYNFVNPNAELRQNYNIDETEHGLVGKSGNVDRTNGWKFGVHPAAAGTLVAKDAMRLDMSIAANRTALADLRLPVFQTYQWYDASATIGVLDGKITIRTAGEPTDTLLRIRFWTNSYPAWSRSISTLSNDFKNEVFRRVQIRARSDTSLVYGTKLEIESLVKSISAEVAAELNNSGGGNVEFDARNLIARMALKSDAFRRIERFAKTIAVLHWVADTSPTGLPPLPNSIEIKRYQIPAELSYEQARFSK